MSMLIVAIDQVAAECITRVGQPSVRTHSTDQIEAGKGASVGAGP